MKKNKKRKAEVKYYGKYDKESFFIDDVLKEVKEHKKEMKIRK